ncbi:unnamed protein product [Oikopleura dioica]|uniref:Uncharacterized protein n=1 Tax=Oikopleura dioica TaxID=34765 RepID=E4XMD6_OIKDI|nr:unnamed protein product [Oikopleura dioica]
MPSKIFLEFLKKLTFPKKTPYKDEMKKKRHQSGYNDNFKDLRLIDAEKISSAIIF